MRTVGLALLLFLAAIIIGAPANPAVRAQSIYRLALPQLACDGCTPGANPDSLIVVLGHTQHVDQAKPYLAGLPVRYSGVPRAADTVLYVVSAEDGPMPQTREAAAAVGTLPRAMDAILLTRTAGADPELLQLVIAETREVLRSEGDPHADTMPIIRETDPNVRLTLRGLQPIPPARALVLLGQSSATGLAAAAAASLPARVGPPSAGADALVFAVTAADGPMPQTREHVEAVVGLAHGADAIFLVGVAAQPDPELQELVVLEMRQLLAGEGEPHWDTMPVLRDSDPNFRLALRGLLRPAP